MHNHTCSCPSVSLLLPSHQCGIPGQDHGTPCHYPWSRWPYNNNMVLYPALFFCGCPHLDFYHCFMEATVGRGGWEGKWFFPFKNTPSKFSLGVPPYLFSSPPTSIPTPIAPPWYQFPLIALTFFMETHQLFMWKKLHFHHCHMIFLSPEPPSTFLSLSSLFILQYFLASVVIPMMEHTHINNLHAKLRFTGKTLCMKYLDAVNNIVLNLHYFIVREV